MTALALVILGGLLVVVWEERAEIFGMGATPPPSDVEPLEFPVPAGWSERDVLATMAEIASL